MDKIEALIKELKEDAEKLKTSIDTEKRDNYEYNLFYLNSEIWQYEEDYEKAQDIYDVDYENKYALLRPDMKSEKATEMATELSLQEQRNKVTELKRKVKKFNREHKFPIQFPAVFSRSFRKRSPLKPIISCHTAPPTSA